MKLLKIYQRLCKKLTESSTSLRPIRQFKAQLDEHQYFLGQHIDKAIALLGQNFNKQTIYGKNYYYWGRGRDGMYLLVDDNAIIIRYQALRADNQSIWQYFCAQQQSLINQPIEAVMQAIGPEDKLGDFDFGEAVFEWSCHPLGYVKVWTKNRKCTDIVLSPHQITK